MAERLGMISGNRLTRGETSGDRRNLSEARQPRMAILRRLWKYLGRNRLLLILAVVLSLSANILSLFGPRLSGQAINAIEAGPGQVDIPYVLEKVGCMALFYTLSALLSYILSQVMIRLSRRVVRQMRRDVFDRLARLPVGFFDRYQTGDILSIITYDVDTVNQSLSADLLQVLQTTVTVSVSFVMMLTIAPKLIFIFCVTIPATVLITRWITNRVHPLFRRRSRLLGALNGFTEEMISGQKTTKAYGQEAAVLEAFDEKNHQAVEAYTEAEANGTIMGPAVTCINNVSLAMVCLFGSLLYLSGGIRLGDLASFVQYSRKFSGPINEVANIVSELQSAFAAAERVFGLMDAAPEAEDSPEAAELKSVRGDVELRNVSFGYEPETPVLKNLSLHARPGELVAIVGPTGAGKTTVINLLMRFYDAEAGSITVDGHDIRQVTRSSLRRAYSMVLQDTWLFQGTVFDNIAYGKKDATMEQVVAAAKAARIHSYIASLPQGYDTILSDNGSSISKGQKQLLTIARAMLLDSHMLILDEATSNVDTQTEAAIQAAMRTLMRDKTCFVIAHRLSTIRNADHILVMRDGQVVEQGNHKTLMAQNGFYAKLYYAQFS
ncbi:MAG: ABC transporter ATP-binding protein/permease [Clostridiales bacterium]|nr:ABC transporter ATP-binding protein/permease [Clostridiales bacterium]